MIRCMSAAFVYYYTCEARDRGNVDSDAVELGGEVLECMALM